MELSPCLAEAEWSRLLLTLWWDVQDLNLKRSGYEPGALPIELTPHKRLAQRSTTFAVLTNKPCAI